MPGGYTPTTNRGRGPLFGQRKTIAPINTQVVCLSNLTTVENTVASTSDSFLDSLTTFPLTSFTTPDNSASTPSHGQYYTVTSPALSKPQVKIISCFLHYFWFD